MSYTPHMNFWEKLEKPIMILAPMDGVTDTVFRQIVCSVGKPDVLFTEYVPTDAILSPAQERALERSLRFSELERPIVATSRSYARACRGDLTSDLCVSAAWK